MSASCHRLYDTTVYSPAASPGVLKFHLPVELQCQNLKSTVSFDPTRCLPLPSEFQNAIITLDDLFVKITNFDALSCSVILPLLFQNTKMQYFTVILKVIVISFPIGAQGYTGHQGFYGAQGFAGDQGYFGNQGHLGDQGHTGQQGFVGAIGNQGTFGSQGRVGDQGHMGKQGFVGHQGTLGDQGASGNQGYLGGQGTIGDQGMPGLRGQQGFGNSGTQGVAGSQGFTGPQGLQGFQGATGAPGLACSECVSFDGITAPSDSNQMYTKKSTTAGAPSGPTNVDFGGNELSASNADGLAPPHNDYPNVYECDDGADKWVSIVNDGAEISMLADPEPPVFPAPENTQLTLGVQFNTAQTGTVSAVRFYKANVQNQAPGTPIQYDVQLWSTTNALPLATGTANINAEVVGWQEIPLSSPVVLSPATTYIASYVTDASGYYTAANNFFASAATAGPLTAPASDDVAGGNGVYAIGSAKPNSTFQKTNYWVDVVFSTSLVPQYLTRVQISDTMNLGCAQTLTVDTAVSANSHDMSQSTVPFDLYIWNLQTLSWDLIHSSNIDDHHDFSASPPFDPISVTLYDIDAATYVDGNKTISFFSEISSGTATLAVDCFNVCISCCGRGPAGEQGPVGPHAVYVNHTNFVDEQYGSASGVREDLAHPFSTISLALLSANANPGDTIYVQPGVYTVTETIVLHDNVNWYFTEGATVICTAHCLFEDSDGAVACSISGYGVFRLQEDGVHFLKSTHASTISIKAQSIAGQATEPAALFDMANTEAGEQTLCVTLESVANTLVASPAAQASVVRVASGENETNVSFACNSSARSPTIVHAVSGLGHTMFRAKDVLSGSSGVSGDAVALGAMVLNVSDLYSITVQAQTIDFRSETQAVQTQNSGTSTDGAPHTSLSALSLATVGGLVWAASGDATKALALQPHVALELGRVSIAGATADVARVLRASSAMVSGNVSVYNNTVRGDTQFDIESLAGAHVSLKFDIYKSDTSAFSVAGHASSVSALYIAADRIECAERLLYVADECDVVVKGEHIDCSTVAESVSAIRTSGTVSASSSACVVLRACALLVNGQAPDVNPRVNIVDHKAGVLKLHAETFMLIGGANYNAILSASPNFGSLIEIGLAGQVAADCVFLRVEQQTTVRSGLIAGGGDGVASTAIECDGAAANCSGTVDGIFMSGTGDAVHVSQGSCNIHFDFVGVFSGSGNAIVLSGTGAVSGSVERAQTDSGVVIRSSSDANLEMSFGSLNSASGARVIELLGSGDARLSGNDIIFGSNSASRVVYLADGAELTLNCNNIRATSCEALIYVDTGAALYLDYQQLVVQPQGFTLAGIYFVGDFCSVTGSVSVLYGAAGTEAGIFAGGANPRRFRGRFGDFSMTSTTAMADATVAVHTEGEAIVDVSFDVLSSQSHCLVTRSANQVLLVATRMSVGTLKSCILIDAPDDNDVVVTVGGYMDAGSADYAIEYANTSAARPLRLLSSDLISATNSIFAPGVLNPSVTVVPSVARQAASGVTLHPAAALFVDANAF